MRTKLSYIMFIRGIKQRELAKATGLTENQVSLLKNGLRMNESQLKVLAKFFHVRPSDLVGYVKESDDVYSEVA